LQVKTSSLGGPCRRGPGARGRPTCSRSRRTSGSSSWRCTGPSPMRVGGATGAALLSASACEAGGGGVAAGGTAVMVDVFKRAEASAAGAARQAPRSNGQNVGETPATAAGRCMRSLLTFVAAGPAPLAPPRCAAWGARARGCGWQTAAGTRGRPPRSPAGGRRSPTRPGSAPPPSA
jgi:hypothetical protein